MDKPDIKVTGVEVAPAKPDPADLRKIKHYAETRSKELEEVTLVLDHIGSQECVKKLARVGGAGGSTVATVRDDYVLNENTTINDASGVYSRNEAVELFQWDGKSYSLSRK